MSKKTLVILGVAAIVIGVVWKFLTTKQIQPGTIKPSGIPLQDLQKGHSPNEVTFDKQALGQLNRGTIINKMADKLPYKGTYFSLDYNYKTLSFVLTLQSAYQQQGNREFDLFLRANGIDDRSWLQPNFQVVVQ